MKFPILGIMFLIFMTLKLVGTITWSWWWVTAPLWGGFGIIFLLGVIGFLSVAAISVLSKKTTITKRKKK